MQNFIINNQVLDDIYKNAHIALQSISNLIADVDDIDLKNELLSQYEGYENIIKEASSIMDENNITKKDINPMKKAMLFTSIKLKTITGADKNKVADMMIQGTNMGIIQLTTIKNDKNKNLDEKVDKLLSDFIALEETYLNNLKKFL